jgi:2-desacetyl-2-hydroxyethyl bacteriochlorophyllide A dehydrogenase
MISRSVWFEAPYQVTVRAESLPLLAPDQVLVQTMVSAISAGTELLFYRGQVPAGIAIDATLASLAGTVQYPLRYGYACVGQVIDLGTEASVEWRDRLVFSFQPHASHFSATPAELLPVPPGLSPRRAAFLPNMETAVNFLLDGAPLMGEQAVVLGQGVVGLLTAALLAQFPLKQVLAFDRFERRREKSKRLGASDAFDPEEPAQINHAKELLGEAGADVTFELSGNPEALNLAIELTGFAGRVIIGSWYGRKGAALDLGGRFHRSRIRLISSQVSTLTPELMARWSKARRMAAAWSMLARVPADELITHTFAIDEAVQAYALLDRQPEQAVQIIFQYE